VELTVEYLSGDRLESVICAETFNLPCPATNNCLEIINDTLICSETAPGYRLQFTATVPEGNYTEDVGLLKVIITEPLAPAIIEYEFTPSLTAGNTIIVDTLIETEIDFAGDTLKVLITAHDGPEERLCCFADSLCLPFPDCGDPCDSLDAIVEFIPRPGPPDECCYEVVVTNNSPTADYFDSLSIDLFFPGAQFPNFLPVNNPAWDFFLPTSTPLSWQFQGNIPTNGGTAEIIATFCINRSDQAIEFEYTPTFFNTAEGGPCSLEPVIVECGPLPTPCDSLSAYLLPNEENCCYDVYLNNTYLENPDLLESVTINLIGGPSEDFDGVSRIPTAPGWNIATVE
ncbi:MAG: hypothetical protein AAFN92_22940, partial [Bacteroidota bacterium]